VLSQIEALDIVHGVSDLTGAPFVARELMIVKVRMHSNVLVRPAPSWQCMLWLNCIDTNASIYTRGSSQVRCQPSQRGDLKEIAGELPRHMMHGLHVLHEFPLTSCMVSPLYFAEVHMRTPDAEIQRIRSAEIFHGKVIDLSSQTITLELQGKEVRPRHTMPTEHYACETSCHEDGAKSSRTELLLL